MQPLPRDEIDRAVQAALAEDIGSGDATTLATVPESTRARAAMIAREPIVVAGLDFAEAAFRQLSPAVRCERVASEGQRIGEDAAILRIEGPARAILTAE